MSLDFILEADIQLDLIICGVLGCMGMIQVTIKLLKENAKIQSANVILGLLLSGVTGLLICFAYMRSFEWPGILIFLMPLLVLAHFVYLLRGYLVKAIRGN